MQKMPRLNRRTFSARRRRPFLGTLGLPLLLSEGSKAMSANVQPKGGDTTAIRPFHVKVPESELTELHSVCSTISRPGDGHGSLARA